MIALATFLPYKKLDELLWIAGLHFIHTGLVPLARAGNILMLGLTCGAGPFFFNF
jgi:hypothetical protein